MEKVILPSRIHEADEPSNMEITTEFPHLHFPPIYDRPTTILISAADYRAIIARYGTLNLDTWAAYKLGKGTDKDSDS